MGSGAKDRHLFPTPHSPPPTPSFSSLRVFAPSWLEFFALDPGHHQQVDALFRRYGAGVGSYVYARVGDAELAESITSAVFLTVVRQIGQCRTTPERWLWSIVRSELARHFRDRKLAEPLGGGIVDPNRGPAENAEAREMHLRTRAALAQLTEEQQRIVYLKFFQDMSNVEIAESLGLSPSNVGVIVHRAVKRMRELMGGSDGALAGKLAPGRTGPERGST